MPRFTRQPALFAGSVFLLGLLIGSFLNVVIYRLPIILERDWRSQAAEVLAPAASCGGTATAPTASRSLHLKHPPLRLPKLQGAHYGAAEHTVRQLAGAALQYVMNE